MNNNIQIVLFYTEDSAYNLTKIVTKMGEKFNDIGDPILLPLNNGAPKESNFPNIIFNQNPSFQITANFNNITINLSGDYIDKRKDIIENIYDIFIQDNMFNRIGYVKSKLYDKNKIKEVKKQYFIDEEVIDSKQFELSWFKKINISNKSVNFWQRYITSNADDKEQKLLSILDFNTNVSNNINISKQFVINFITECDKHSE